LENYLPPVPTAAAAAAAEAMEPAHLQEIHVARQAAQSLAAYADSACRKGTLRDDTHNIAEEALQLLQELEEKVSLLELCPEVRGSPDSLLALW
jgi:hypothetical protein